MYATKENRKLAIIDHLAELEDEYVLQQIENLLNPNYDFWDDLSPNQKKKIEIGLEQAEDGQTIDFETFITSIK